LLLRIRLPWGLSPTMLPAHPRPAGQEPQRDMSPLITHPARQILAGIGNALQAREEFEQPGFHAGPPGKIRVDRRRNLIAVLEEQAFEAMKAVEARCDIWLGVGQESLALNAKQRTKIRSESHVDHRPCNSKG